MKGPIETTVTVTLPRKWMAEMFLEWVEEAFKEKMLANEGQHLESTIEGTTVVFIRVKDQEQTP